MLVCTCLSVLPLEGARIVHCTLLSLSWNFFVPREYYIRWLCGRIFAVLLYRDTWGRLLAEICVDKLWFFHAQRQVLWIRVLSGFLFLTSAPGLGRRIDILLLSPCRSIAAATVRVLSCWFRWLPMYKRDPIEYHVHIFIILGCFFRELSATSLPSIPVCAFTHLKCIVQFSVVRCRNLFRIFSIR